MKRMPTTELTVEIHNSFTVKFSFLSIFRKVHKQVATWKVK